MSHFDVIVVGAGVVGPAISTALARQGRSVLLIERDWTQPDRIVGELMQPAGLRALKSLGMIEAVNNIEAIHVDGYSIFYHGEKLTIDYPYKEASFKPEDVPHCVTNSNNKIITDSTLSAKYFEESEREVGVAFRHGEFIMNLRKIAKAEDNIKCLKAVAIKINRDESDRVVGVTVNEDDKSNVEYTADLTICCDGIFSKFRKELSKKNLPSVGSHFVSLSLENADLPSPNHGHVIISDQAPILVYQISPKESRILCAYRSKKLPSLNDPLFKKYLHDTLPNILPKQLLPSYQHALDTSRVRVMPNSYLVAKKNTTAGLLVLGDALNMRHPLTGGGMTVGLNDAALIAKLLAPEIVPSFKDTDKVLGQLSEFHTARKPLDSVINVLSIALYCLFAANNRYLAILQEGCFHYLLKIQYPIALLSGLIPSPYMLFKHFFAVAFFSIGRNFEQNGWLLAPLSIYEGVLTLYCAIVVFTPFMWKEWIS